MKRTFALLAVLLAVVLVAASAAPVAAQSPERSYLLVAQNKIPNRIEQDVAAIGGTVERTIPQIGVIVVSSSNPDFQAQAAGIKGIQSALPNVSLQWIDPIRREAVTADQFGNPPNSGDDDFFFDLQWGHDAVDAPEAWAAGARGAGVRVAVLDDGIDSDHPDLAPNFNAGLSTSFVPGQTYEYAVPGDVFSHGTHVSGTIAAADNGIGTIGVAPEAELVMVKVLDSFTGSGSFEGVAAGIVHAADIDADIINMSLGATVWRSGYLDDMGTPEPEDDVFVTAREVSELVNMLGRATRYAYQNGSTIIASAGNEANDGDHDADLLHLPSDLPHVISISATGPVGWAVDPSVSLDNLASYSNYGQSVIDFAAPGGDAILPGEDPCTVAGLERPCWVFDLVFSTGSAGSYYWSAGTSMAAPHASGVAALIIGANGGDMKPQHVERDLRHSADDLGKPGNDDAYGMGRVNAGNYFN